MAGFVDSYTDLKKTAADDRPLDFLVKTIKNEDESLVRDRLHRFVHEAVTHGVRRLYEAEASLNYQYIENDFYTDEELARLAERGQPPTRRNEIAPILERIAGQFIQTRQLASFLGRNTPADDPVSFLAQDHQRWEDQQNLYEFREQEVVWDGMAGGVGWLKLDTTINEIGQIVTRMRTRNPFHVFLDPFSQEYDPNEDAKYIAEGAWMDVEDAIERWPDKEDELRAILSGPTGTDSYAMTQVANSLRNEVMSAGAYDIATYVDGQRRRVRPFEVWYKRKIKVHYLFGPNGVSLLPIPLDLKKSRALVKELATKGKMEVEARPVWQERMYVGVILAGVLIHHDVSPHNTNLFPYVPFYSGRRKNGAPLPLASRLVPINEAINKRESRALSLLNNRQIIAEKNTFEDKEEAAAEHAKPNGFVETKEGALSQQRVLFRDNLDMGQAQMALLQEDKDAIRRVSGHGNESMGMPSEVRSGTGIARKQMMSNLIVLPMNNNLRRTRYLKARLQHEYQKQYLTEEMSFQLTDDPNMPRVVQLTKDAVSAIKERIYDIVITDQKDYAVVREQQAEMMLTVLPQLAQLGPGYVKLGLSLAEFRDKEALMRMVDAQTQPQPVQPKISLAMTWADMTAEEKAFVAFQAFQSEELAQAIMAKQDDPAFFQKLKTALIQTQIKEGTRASMERGRVDFAAMQTAIEGMLEKRKMMAKNEPMMGAGMEAGQPEAEPMDEGVL